jgi:hypothetical protein
MIDNVVHEDLRLTTCDNIEPIEGFMLTTSDNANMKKVDCGALIAFSILFFRSR